MFRHRLFGIQFKPTNTMYDPTGTQAPAQAGIEDFNGIFQERLSGIVRDGLLLMFIWGQMRHFNILYLGGVAS